MSYQADQIASAQAALDLNNTRLRLEDGNPPETALYHLLGALLEWCDAQRPIVDFDLALENVRADYRDGAANDSARLITAGGPVAICDTAISGPDSVVARFATIDDAEAFLNVSAAIDPDKLAAGAYSIDAPHGMGNDEEARAFAERAGFDLFYSMGGAYYSKGPHRSDMSNWSAGFQNLHHAAHVALSTIEP